MKPSSIAFTAVAIFAGVLGALQTDHYLAARADRDPNGVQWLQASEATIRPADYDVSGPAFDFRGAAKKVMPSVVSVHRYENVSRGFGFFDDDTPQDTTPVETAQGSGVIVSADGTIVTNNHVVTDEQGNVVPEVKVSLNDNRQYTAKVLGHDPRSDLAVLKISAPNLSPIEIGNSATVDVGQWVMAVGNPLGFNNTVSVGVVSSLKRNLPVGDQGLVDAIQTDAAINPGNSGGALTDAQGHLIGINAAIASGTGQSVGIGFAIPVDRVKTVVNDIVKYGYARYAGLGVSYPRQEGLLAYPQIQEQIAQQTGTDKVPTSGVIVTSAQGAAGAAGIKPYDIILAMDGQPVQGSFDMNRILMPKKPGDSVSVKYWSRGQIKTATVKLQEIRPNI